MDDDFFINDDELAQDNQLSIVDISKDKLLENIISIANDMKFNLKFNEKTDCESNLKILSTNLSSLITMFEIDETQLSEEEIQNQIDNIIRQTTELSFTNLDDIVKKEPEEKTETNSENIEPPTKDDDSLGW